MAALRAAGAALLRPGRGEAAARLGYHKKVRGCGELGWAGLGDARWPLVTRCTRQVVDHYENPRNVGSLDRNAKNVGTGLVGAPACGDVMKLQVTLGTRWHRGRASPGAAARPKPSPQGSRVAFPHTPLP